MNEMLEAPVREDHAFWNQIRADLSARAKTASAPAWLSARRERAAARALELGLPKKKNEAWRFTSLRPLDKLATANRNAASAAKSEFPVFDAKAHIVVFTNGQFDASASRLADLPPGCRIATIEAAFEVERPEASFGALAKADEHVFNALNEALFQNGACLRLAADIALEQPIHVVHMYDPAASHTAKSFTHPRLLTILERGAKARILEHFVGAEDHASFCNPVHEILVHENAQLDYVRLQDEGRGAIHLGRVAARIERHGVLSALSVAWGAEIARAEITVELVGEGAECTIDGLYLPAAGQHHDHTIALRHLAPHTQSRQNFKGILADTGRALFRGAVYVAPDAQKIESRQSNKNLLLSPRAWVDTLPQLEIHADDVKCSHGATIGRLDMDAMHYLRSRGIGREDARSLLTFAFANEILSEIKEPMLHEKLEARLRTWLAARGTEPVLA